MRVARRHLLLANGEGESLKAEQLQDLYNIELEVLGDRIRRARLEKKISQRDLSNNLFTSAYLSSLELGKTRPTPTTLVELARRLDKSLDYFLRPANGLLDAGRVTDEDYLKVLRARQSVWQAYVAVERARTQALLSHKVEQPSPETTQASPELLQGALEEVERQLVRLNPLDRARYQYLLGRYYHGVSGEADKAFTALEEAQRQLEEAQAQAGRNTERQQLLELGCQVQIELGDLYFEQGRVMQALSQFQTALDSLNNYRPLPTNPATPTAEPSEENGTLELLSANSSNGTGANHSKARLAPGLNRLRWRILIRLAHCYSRLNDREQTLETMRQASLTINSNPAAGQPGLINYAPALSSTSALLSLSDYYYDQTRLYNEQGDFQQASLRVGRCLELHELTQDGFELLDAYAWLAELELNNGQYDQAEQEVRQVLAWLNGDLPGYRSQKLKALITLAQVRHRQGQLDQALETVQQAQDLLPGEGEETGSTELKVEVARLYQTAAEVEARRNQRQQAEQYYQQALAVLPDTKEVSSPAMADIYYSYGQQLREWGEVERAFELLEKAYRFRQK